MIFGFKVDLRLKCNTSDLKCIWFKVDLRLKCKTSALNARHMEQHPLWISPEKKQRHT